MGRLPRPPRARSIDELIAWQPAAVGRLLEAARRRIHAAVPMAIERLRPGWGLIGYQAPAYFAFLQPMPDHVRLGFELGVELADPAGLLEGADLRQVRYLVVREPAALRVPALTDLLREAATLPPRRAGSRRGGSVRR